MAHKDLAEKYLTEAKESAIYFKDGNFPNMPLYQENDIKAAFNAGRERVFNDFPKLLYNEDGDNSLAVDIFNNVCLIIKLKGDSRYKFVVAYKESTQLYDTLEEAKQAANEDYKKRIKQALGL